MSHQKNTRNLKFIVFYKIYKTIKFIILTVVLYSNSIYKIKMNFYIKKN